MRAVVWHGKADVRVERVADPAIQKDNDVIVRVTSSGLCGSDLHLYQVLDPFLDPGDILGHEPMGIVEEVGSAIRHLRRGDRVVVPFNISCGHCYMCDYGLYSQCEVTRAAEGMGAALFGYTRLYGSVPGGQAEYLRVPEGQFGPIKIADDRPDDRYLYLSDVLPTAWQAVEYARIPPKGSVAVYGLGPIGQMCCRIAAYRGAGRVFGIDLVEDRLEIARRYGIETIDITEHDGSAAAVLADATEGRGPGSVIDAVGMEAHGAGPAKLLQELAGMVPDQLAEKVMTKAGVDRLGALYDCIDATCRGGTLSLSGVYAGVADPIPMMRLFDKQITLTMGQANVWRWVPEVLPILQGEEDPLGVDSLASHHLPLSEAPGAYEMFQKKTDQALKVVFHPQTESVAG